MARSGCPPTDATWVLLGLDVHMGAVTVRDADADTVSVYGEGLPVYQTAAACQVALRHAIQKYAGRSHAEGNMGRFLCVDWWTWAQKVSDNPSLNAAQSAPLSVLAQIKQRAVAKYPADYEMQEYKVKQQTAAYIAVQNFVLPQVPEDVFQQIKTSAFAKYHDYYEMQEYKMKQQRDAYMTINNYSNPALPNSVLSQNHG